METSRRGFFKWLGGAGVAVVPAALGAYSIGVDTGKGEDRTAFNFMCSCGASLVAAMPKKEGDHVLVDCDCGAKLDLEWCGDHFKTKMRGGKDSRESYYG